MNDAELNKAINGFVIQFIDDCYKEYSEIPNNNPAIQNKAFLRGAESFRDHMKAELSK